MRNGSGIAGWNFWLLFTLAGAVGMIVGQEGPQVVLIWVAAALGLPGPHAVIGTTTASTGGFGFWLQHGLRHLVTGTTFALFQWPVVRRPFQWVAWWMWVGAVTIATYLGGVIPHDDSFVSGMIVGATNGILAGTLHWLLLRRQIPQAGWWVLASTIGTSIGWGVGFVFSTPPPAYATNFLGSLLAGTVTGGLTGLGLVWLLRSVVAPRIRSLAAGAETK